MEEYENTRKLIEEKKAELKKEKEELERLQQSYVEAAEKSTRLRQKYEAKNRAFLDEQAGILAAALTPGMRCPVCGRGTIIRGKTRYGCSRWREGCTYAESF